MKNSGRTRRICQLQCLRMWRWFESLRVAGAGRELARVPPRNVLADFSRAESLGQKVCSLSAQIATFLPDQGEFSNFSSNFLLPYLFFRPLLMLPKNRPEKVGFRIWTKSGFLYLPDSSLFRVNFFWDQLFGRASSGNRTFSGLVHTQKISSEKCHHTHKPRTAQQVLAVARSSRAPSNP